MRFALVLGLLLGGCVQDALVIGDERAYAACQDAIPIGVPPVGCTTVTLDSLGPYGCLDEATSTNHSGSWARVSRPAGVPATIRVTAAVAGCADAGVCGATATVAFGATPCSCAIGTTTRVPVTTDTEIPFDATDEEILLEPLGAHFAITVCSSM